MHGCSFVVVQFEYVWLFFVWWIIILISGGLVLGNGCEVCLVSCI